MESKGAAHVKAHSAVSAAQDDKRHSGHARDSRGDDPMDVGAFSQGKGGGGGQSKYFDGDCYVCGRHGHRAADCRKGKGGKGTGKGDGGKKGGKFGGGKGYDKGDGKKGDGGKKGKKGDGGKKGKKGGRGKGFGSFDQPQAEAGNPAQLLLQAPPPPELDTAATWTEESWAEDSWQQAEASWLTGWEEEGGDWPG